MPARAVRPLWVVVGLFGPLLLMLVLLAVILLGCGPAPTSPGIQRVHVLCTLTRVNDSTLSDVCR